MTKKKIVKEFGQFKEEVRGELGRMFKDNLLVIRSVTRSVTWSSPATEQYLLKDFVTESANQLAILIKRFNRLLDHLGLHESFVPEKPSEIVIEKKKCPKKQK